MRSIKSITNTTTIAITLIVVGCTGDVADPDVETGQEQSALGVSGPAFYADGTLYRTVGTPALLPDSAPSKSFDTIYDVSTYQMYNVTEAAPGTPGYNGGRWEVHAIEFEDYDAALATHDANQSGDFDSDEEIDAALDASDATDLGIVLRFECPVIPLPRGR
jgi:hypothetical protein